MTDELERDLRAMLADRGAVTPDDIDALRAYAGSLPTRRARPRLSRVLRVAAVLAAVAIGGGALSVGLGQLERSGWIGPPASDGISPGVPASPQPSEVAGTPTSAPAASPGTFPYILSCGPVDQAACEALASGIAERMARVRPGKDIVEIDIADACGGYTVHFADGTMVRAIADCTPPTAPTPAPVTGTRLELEVRVKAGCGSIGGCAYFLEIAGQGSPRRVELAPGSGDPNVLAGILPGTLAPGTHSLTFTSRPVSEEVIDGEPLLGGVLAECALELVLEATREEVAVTVWFGQHLCTAESTSSPPETPWHDEAGAWRREVSTHQGPGHCGWDGTISLGFEGETFIRDPLGVRAEHTAEPYAETDELPTGARDSGLSNVRWHLFLSDDSDFVYMQTNVGTFERWARDVSGLGCT